MSRTVMGSEEIDTILECQSPKEMSDVSVARQQSVLGEWLDKGSEG